MTGRHLFAVLGAITLPTLSGPNPASAQSDGGAEEIFAETCAECHSSAQSGRTPSRASLASLSPRAIVAALDDGVMRAEGEDLTLEQRVALAEYVTQRSYAAERLPETAYCADPGFGPLDVSALTWMGYGGDLGGTGFQPANRAGMEAADLPHLRLKWAFGLPDASQVRTKPTAVDGLLIVGDQFGYVYAIDAESGCVRWTFEADSGLRSAILVGAGSDGHSVAYFVDYRTSAYALDVETGSVLWKTRVGWHPESNNTGSPVLHGDRLIVPISSMEVARAGDPTYECCTSSGAVAAVDVTTGDVDWYYRVIEQEPEEAGTNSEGTPLWAPSGAPVWSSPTVDARRGLVYIGTGENYTRPTSESSDAIAAVDLETGELAWSFQATEADAFTMACSFRGPGCPSPPGPDLDFGMAPMLVTRPDGKEILVAGQKSGVVWALDPDAAGAILWATQVGKGGALGGIHWGMATDGRLAFAANSDRGAVIVDVHPDKEPSPGLYGIDLMTGQVVWGTPAPDDTCDGRRGCHPANSAAPTAIPGAVFAGGLDGHIRAYSAEDGRILWDFDTARDFETVNGVPGRGGSIDGPGPVVADGMLFVNSGYGSFSQMAGNVLLAFEVGGR
jgi:polyvinyl alcohol dehydrogenase (cytochrome)